MTKKIKIWHVKFQPFLLGFGYWKDDYNPTFDGYAHNILLPFFRIQVGEIKVPEGWLTEKGKQIAT